MANGAEEYWTIQCIVKHLPRRLAQVDERGRLYPGVWIAADLPKSQCDRHFVPYQIPDQIFFQDLEAYKMASLFKLSQCLPKMHLAGSLRSGGMFQWLYFN